MLIGVGIIAIGLYFLLRDDIDDIDDIQDREFFLSPNGVWYDSDSNIMNNPDSTITVGPDSNLVLNQDSFEVQDQPTPLLFLVDAIGFWELNNNEIVIYPIIMKDGIKTRWPAGSFKKGEQIIIYGTKLYPTQKQEEPLFYYDRTYDVTGVFLDEKGDTAYLRTNFTGLHPDTTGWHPLRQVKLEFTNYGKKLIYHPPVLGILKQN